MRLHCLNFISGLTVDYGKSNPKSKKNSPKGAWSGSRDRFWDDAAVFKFRKCIDYGECHTGG